MPLPLSSRAKSRDPYSSCRKKKRILRLALLAQDDRKKKRTAILAVRFAQLTFMISYSSLEGSSGFALIFL